MICSMPICPRQQNDRMVWTGSRNREFIVKIAYHFAKNMVESTTGCNSNTENDTQFRKKVGRVKGPKVLTSFLWKACGDILPTKGNLHRRGVIEDPLCPICKMEPETVSHALWNCPSATDVWLESSSRIHKCAIMEDSFSNIFNLLHDKFGEEDIQLIAITARLIWLRHNSVVFGGEFLPLASLARQAREQVEASNSTDQARHDNMFRSSSVPQTRWIPPEKGLS